MGDPKPADETSPLPRQWSDVLCAPAFVINLPSSSLRLAATLEELTRAGFTDIRPFQAVDGRDSEALATAWGDLGSPRFAAWDEQFTTKPGKQGCFVSHVKLWEHLAAKNIPYACVFEDDIFFHRHWEVLAPTFFDFTPRDFDLVYLGSQIEVPGTGLVRAVPVHCTHAYLITSGGAQRLKRLLLEDPDGVATIDSMIIAHQKKAHRGTTVAPFTWYVWDGSLFPDRRTPDDRRWRIRNTGLVFQDLGLASDIEPNLRPLTGGETWSVEQTSAAAPNHPHYDLEFYVSKRKEVSATARTVVPMLLEWIQPSRVIDLGCGTGEWLAMFQELGVTEVLGVDGDWVPREELFVPPHQFLSWDLRSPLHLDSKFDLALSLETAEHLPPETAETLVSSLTGLAPAVVFSAAIPNQPGTDHVNLQWPSYWADLFARRGYVAIDAIRPRIWEAPDIPYWYAQNMILFAKEESLATSERLRTLWERHGGPPLSLVHPVIFTHLVGGSR